MILNRHKCLLLYRGDLKGDLSIGCFQHLMSNRVRKGFRIETGQPTVFRHRRCAHIIIDTTQLAVKGDAWRLVLGYARGASLVVSFERFRGLKTGNRYAMEERGPAAAGDMVATEFSVQALRIVSRRRLAAR